MKKHELPEIKRVLFVCVENSCRSQMAEAFAGVYGTGHVQAYSAGSNPSGKVSKAAVEVMYELGYNLSEHHPKPLGGVPEVEYDAVVSMGCEDGSLNVNARRREDWNIPDPAPMPKDGFRAVRDLIEEKVKTLLSSL
jgi:protein-tyrosine-phosphatase